MAAEQGVDFAAIRPGDKVKLRYHGLESTDWHEVIRLDAAGGIQVGVVAGVDWYVAERGEVAVIAHQPAPRKVEVTLGEPLTIVGRFYSDKVVAARNFGDDRLDVYLNTGGHTRPLPTHLTPDVARRLALDILATVGVDD